MRKLLALLISLALTVPVYAAPPTDHDGAGTQTFTLDWSTMVTETNPASAQYRIIDGVTAGSWVAWASPWADAVLTLPATTESVTIQLEVTDLAGNANAYGTDQLVIPYALAASDCPSGTYILAWDGDHGDGTNYICHTSGAGALAATVVGTVTISPTYGESGSNGMRLDSTGRALTFSQTSGQYLSATTSQTVWMRVYADTAPETITVFAGEYDGSNYITLETRVTDGTLGTYRGTTTGTDLKYSSGTLGVNAWTDIGISWNSTNGNFAVCIGGLWAEDAGDISDLMDYDITQVTIGPRYGSTTKTTDTLIDRAFVLSGYQATMPW